MNATTAYTQNYPQSSAHDEDRSHSEKKRMLTFVAGASALVLGLSRKGWASRMLALAGGYLLYRSAAAGKAQRKDVLVGQTINKSPQEVYSFFRDPQHWPSLGGSFAASRATGEGEAAASEPLMEITDEAQDRTLRWRFRGEDSGVELSAHFSPAPGNRGTEVWLFAECVNPASGLRELLKKAAGNSLEQLVREHLRHCKQLLEAGEILTTEGQPSGKRGLKGKAMRAMLHENPTETKPSASTTRTPSEERAAS